MRAAFAIPSSNRSRAAFRPKCSIPRPPGRCWWRPWPRPSASISCRTTPTWGRRRVALPAARGALDAGRVRRVKDFIETHLDRDLTIETLAKEACLSPFHFARAFKAATGMAPHRYGHGPPDRKGEGLDRGRTDVPRRDRLSVRVLLPGLLHEVVQAAGGSHSGRARRQAAALVPRVNSAGPMRDK